MGALPKRKISVSRKNTRRASHFIKTVELTICPNCKRAMKAHNVCTFCGKYKGSVVLKGQL